MVDSPIMYWSEVLLPRPAFCIKMNPGGQAGLTLRGKIEKGVTTNLEKNSPDFDIKVQCREVYVLGTSRSKCIV